MKRTLSALLAVLLLAVLLAAPALAEEPVPPELSGTAYYVVNLDTGLVVC